MKTANIHSLEIVRAVHEALCGRTSGLPGIGVVYGPAGWGKTTALVAVANRTRAYYVQMRSAWGRKALLDAILRQMSLPARGTVASMLEDICEQLAKSGRPLIIDEFDFCLKSDGLIEIVRDIYEGSQSPIIVSGEELLPRKLTRWERFHSRVLSWAPVQPVSLADAKLLAPIYCETPCAEDFLEMLVAKSGGSVRRVCVNLAQAAQVAALEGWRRIDLKTWGERPIYTGRAPTRELPEGV